MEHSSNKQIKAFCITLSSSKLDKEWIGLKELVLDCWKIYSRKKIPNHFSIMSPNTILTTHRMLSTNKIGYYIKSIWWINFFFLLTRVPIPTWNVLKDIPWSEVLLRMNIELEMSHTLIFYTSQVIL